jgi:demethylmenaquinone methyltransferase/2-methoxy-6-polyprenyl-1,4-benzoquinol methylase
VFSRLPSLHEMRRAPVASMNNSALPQGQEKVVAVRTMFDRIAPRYELVNRLITFGLDAHWRNVAMRRLSLPTNSLVLDIACGTGDFCRLLQKHEHRPIGIDMSLGMLQAARTTAPLMQADALQLPFADGTIDGITCGFALRNFVDLNGFFTELARVVRPSGRITLLDAYQPSNRVLRAGHSFYFGKVVPLIGGAISDKAAYTYLPKSLGYLPPITDMLASLETVGFHAVQRTTFLGGSAHLITATRA